MEKIVEIANFRQAERAEVLASLLRSEGIDCYVRNDVSSRVFGGLVDIGARVELLESDMPRAVELMKIGGFLSDENDTGESLTCYQTETSQQNTVLSRFSFEKRIIIILVLLIFLIALLIYFGSSLSSPKY